jgi:hypothetical protein
MMRGRDGRTDAQPLRPLQHGIRLSHLSRCIKFPAQNGHAGAPQNGLIALDLDTEQPTSSASNVSCIMLERRLSPGGDAVEMVGRQAAKSPSPSDHPLIYVKPPNWRSNSGICAKLGPTILEIYNNYTMVYIIPRKILQFCPKTSTVLEPA